MRFKALLVAAFCAASTGLVFAKLPPPTEEQKAKAEEAKAKAAEAAKKDAELLAKAQDRVAARYIQQQKAKGITVTPTAIAPPAPASPAVVAPATPVKPAPSPQK